MNFKVLFLFLVLGYTFCSCEKNNCPKTMELTVSKTDISVGDDFQIIAPSGSGNEYFRWSGPGNFSSITSNILSIYNASYSSNGWYYCNKTLTDCNKTITDSIYVDVKLLQEAAPCTPTNNYLSFTSIPSVALTSVTFAMDQVYNGMSFTGNGAFGYPADFKVVFNSFNGNFDPPDGVYKTTGNVTFNVTQPFEDVSISFVYNSGYFHSVPGQKIYVTHIGGKVSVSMCNLTFSYVGTGLTTKCTAKLTKP